MDETTNAGVNIRFEGDEALRSALYNLPLDRKPRWDVVPIDVPGTEFELCLDCLMELSAKVRRVVTGTHSREIDGDLMDLMIRAGWRFEREQPTRISLRADVRSLFDMLNRDSTQVWRNQGL